MGTGSFRNHYIDAGPELTKTDIGKLIKKLNIGYDISVISAIRLGEEQRKNNTKRGTLVYLATPYSHPQDPTVCAKRFEEVNRAASVLMRRGLHIYSPISHTHPIALAGGLPGDWEYWNSYCRAILNVCGSMIVLMQPGWQDSKGVREEIAIAVEMGLKIEYMDMEGSVSDYP
jgi:hypothetical protein